MVKQPVLPLLETNLKSWFSAKGFWLVSMAALVPLALTGAWLGTHQDDVTVSSVSWSPTEGLTEGQNVTITAVVENVGKNTVRDFNGTLSVGRVVGATLRADATNTVVIDELAPGETRTLNITWTAKPGIFFVLADADSADSLGEIDEFNNQVPKPIVVDYKEPDAGEAPAAPAGLEGNASSERDVDVAVERVEVPGGMGLGDNATFRALVTNSGNESAENVTVTLRVGQSFQGSLFAEAEETRVVTVPPGETVPVEVTWTAREGAYWAEAYAQVVNYHDVDDANNHAAESFVVNPVASPDLEFPEPPDKLTIKEFYLDILSLLHLRFLIPLIALFYAAGVLSDEKQAGTLTYLLTRPVKRWLIPLTKFAASFAVAAVAITLGLVLTFALLFGTPEGNLGFLTTPILVSLLTLFAYGALFILIGVLVDRPYLVGAAFLIGWETAAGIFVPWVTNLTIAQHLQNAIGGWRLDAGVQWLPEGADAVRAVWILLIAGVAFLGASFVVMRRREFEL